MSKTKTKDKAAEANDSKARTVNDAGERYVIVTTEFRGVFAGWAKETSGDTIQLRDARMAIRWGTTRGIMELSEVGPNATSKISARADVELRKVTAVFEVTPAAAKAWDEAR